MKPGNLVLLIPVFVSFLGLECATGPEDRQIRGNRNSISANQATTPETSVPSSADDAVEELMGSPTPELSPLPPDPRGVQAAIDVVQQYYRALNERDYRKAYELWSGNGEASGKSFEEFSAGFADTASTEIDTSGESGHVEGAAGSHYVAIPGVITARTTDGRIQRYWGEYVLRRSVVEGSTADQRAWRIHSAKFRQL